MKENIKTTLWILFWLSIAWIIFAIMSYTFTLPDKYNCDDFKTTNIEVISEVKFSAFWLPYNRCKLKINDKFYTAWKYNKGSNQSRYII